MRCDRCGRFAGYDAYSDRWRCNPCDRTLRRAYHRAQVAMPAPAQLGAAGRSLARGYLYSVNVTTSPTA